MLKSIRNRIALWHVFMFVAMSLISFLLMYQLLDRFLLQRIDQLQIERVKRNEWYGNKETQTTLEGHINYYMRIEGTQSVAYFVYDTEGMIFAAPEASEWSQFSVDPEVLKIISRSKYKPEETLWRLLPDAVSSEIQECPDTYYAVFETRVFQDQTYRYCFARLRDGKVHLSVHNLRQNEQFLSELRQTFWAVFGVMILLGGVAGLFLANKSVRGLKKVTRIAAEIETGNFEERLDSAGEGSEIEDLADRFNAMLDKIQFLLETLSNVSDDIAHDLRTPIARIRGTAEMTLTSEHAEKEQYESALCSIVEECDRLEVMIKTMLEIAQTDSGALELEFADIDLWELLRQGCELFRPAAEDRGLTLELDIPNTSETIAANLNRMQRVVSNLLDNAIKFTATGGSIVISGEVGREMVTVHVKDSGIGIPPEEQEKIFDRFYRRDPSRTVEGNGLGLCLARSILRAHKGDLQVASVEAEGSCFSFSLPRAQRKEG